MMINGLAALCASTLTLIAAEQASGLGEAPHRPEPVHLAAGHICTASSSAKICFGLCDRCIWKNNNGCSEWNGWSKYETLQKEKETCFDCAAESSAGPYTI